MHDNSMEHLTLTPVDFSKLHFYDSLFQSGFWAYFKSYHEKDADAFIVSYRNRSFPLVTIHRDIGRGHTYTYAPRAPQIDLTEDEQGPFLENLARELVPRLPSSSVFIRFDTIWNSPYDTGNFYTDRNQWEGPPRKRVREIRMNYFTETKNLRKSSTDLLPPDTILLDLEWGEEELFMDMRPNTRNCIRRAAKKGVAVQDASIEYLPEWYSLYLETAHRKKFDYFEYDYFHSLFTSAHSFGMKVSDRYIVPEFHLLLANGGKDILSGMILGIYGNTAYYLYAGSSTHKRDHMPNYRLQWEAIKMAKEIGCRNYDLFGIPPNENPEHRQHGLFRFKTGFGGSIVHNRGCWDYPVKEEEYTRFSISP